MIITETDLQFASRRSASTAVRQHETLTAWRSGPDGTVRVNLENVRETLRMEDAGERIILSTAAAQMAREPESTVRPAPGTGSAPAALDAGAAPAAAMDSAGGVQRTHEIDAASATDFESLRLAVLVSFVERITGRRIELVRVPAPDAQRVAAMPELVHSEPAAAPPGAAAAPEATRWGAAYSRTETVTESEMTRFEASGTVRTADGRQIRLAVELDMSRRFTSQSGVVVRAGEAVKDPLVINFGGNAAALTTETMRFDLDADGELDAIATLAPGSGYLALDRNGDGRINDGSELFGPHSGDGFADLAHHDDDGNGWIDENDAVFSRLLVWSLGPDGQERLQGLLELGIGAIHLGRASTEFALRDDQNSLLGQLRSTGVFLYENGGVGTVQQLDLAI